MLTAILATLLALIIPVMAYIPYKHPFNNQEGQITKWARFFGWLVVISFLLGSYLAYDTFNTSKENKDAQTKLTGTIGLLDKNVKNMSKKIDSVGFKIDRVTGRLIQKNAPELPIKNIKYHDISLNKKQLTAIFKEVEIDVKRTPELSDLRYTKKIIPTRLM